MIKRNYHTHMKYCNHAVGDVKDYVEKAIEYGYLELGMSDHAPIPLNSMTKEEWDKNYCGQNMTLDTFDIYLKDIEECQKKYKNINILKALESEYLIGYEEHYIKLREKLDYMVLGIHFYKYDGKVIDTYNECNYNNIDGYLECAIKAIDSKLFKYIGHPDLFYYHYLDKNGEHKFDEKCEYVSRRIIEYAINNNIYLEINANGIRFANCNDMYKYKYPNVNFWKIASEYKDLNVIIGADAHDPKLLKSEWIEYAIEFAKNLGIKVVDKMEF